MFASEAGKTSLPLNSFQEPWEQFLMIYPVISSFSRLINLQTIIIC